MEIINNKYIKMNNDQIQIERMDLYTKIHKKWKINPKTKIKESKKNVYNRKLSKKEIKNILLMEDF